VLRQQLTGTRNRLAIRVQVTLRRAQVSVAGDLPEYMHAHAHVSHPRQPGVPQAVTLELLVSKLGDDLVPASFIPKRGRGDPPTPGHRGNPAVTSGSETYRRCSLPRQLPTLRVLGSPANNAGALS
jgi:hypothetical protein